MKWELYVCSVKSPTLWRSSQHSWGCKFWIGSAEWLFTFQVKNGELARGGTIQLEWCSPASSCPGSSVECHHTHSTIMSPILQNCCLRFSAEVNCASLAIRCQSGLEQLLLCIKYQMISHVPNYFAHWDALCSNQINNYLSFVVAYVNWVNWPFFPVYLPSENRTSPFMAAHSIACKHRNNFAFYWLIYLFLSWQQYLCNIYFRFWCFADRASQYIYLSN